MKDIILHSPLFVVLPRVRVPDKKWTLNLNNYRNAPYHLLDDVKKAYKEAMKAQICALKPFSGKVMVAFVNYKATKRRLDTSNVCSVHDKFFMDALVELGKLSDDDDETCIKTIYLPGGVDRKNPRVQIHIQEVL